jgi:MFS family permease
MSEAAESRASAVASLLAASLGFLFAATDIVLLIFFQQEIAAALDVPLGQVRIAIGVGLLGSAVGGLVFAPLGDRYGRVRALAWSVGLYSAATGAMAVVPSMGALFVLRFIAGIGTGGEWSLGFAQVAETWPRAGRGARGGLVTGMFNLGTFVAIGLYHSGLGWRSAFALMLLPGLYGLWLRRRVPESAAFVALSRAREAANTPEAARARISASPLRAVLAPEHRGTVLRLILLFALLNFGFYGFSTLFMQFLVAAPAQGGLGLSRPEELPYHLVLNFSALTGVVVAGAASDRLGRRGAFSTWAALGAGAFLWLLTLASSPTPSAALMLAFGSCCFAFGVNGIIGAWTPELFATHVRATGPGLCQNLGKGIGGMAGPIVAGRIHEAHGFATFFLLPAVLFFLCGLLAWTFPRVDGRSLDEV